jgi:hypothetical protein
MHWLVLAGIIFLVFVFTYAFVDIFIRRKAAEPGTDSWARRRCNVDVLFTAFKYKPKNDPRSKLEFMQDNFSFCIGSLIDEVFKSAMAPFMGILATNVDSLGVFSGALNNMRGLLGVVHKKFGKIMDITFNRFKTNIYNFAFIWHRLNFAFQRVMSIALSTVYMGISFVAGFMNFYDLVVNVVIIILAILLALIFLLFFILIPVMPVIFTILAVLAGAGFGAAIGGMESGFCVDPDALVRMADGSLKPLKECRVGDVLAPGSGAVGSNIIEGILTCDGTTEDCVRIDGIAMSKSHRVLYNGHYILAGLHPHATHMASRLPHLICLNTSHHAVPMNGMKETVWVGDWEEVDTEEGRSAWIEMTYSFLNRGLDDRCLFMNKPTTPPILSPHTIVKERKKGYVTLQEITIGDIVLDGNGEWTTVLATYSGAIHGTTRGERFWYSDGVWVRGSDSDYWNTCIYGSVKMDAGAEKLAGVNIITESGTYVIRQHGLNVLVRDFTEMGIDMVKKSYDMLDSYVGASQSKVTE